MPAPYSDNMYSADWADDSDAASTNDLESHLSPTDGYFHASTSSALGLYPPQQEDDDPLRTAEPPNPSRPQFAQPTSAGAPHVPNVLVEDPSLASRNHESSKAREAREERTRGQPTPASAPAPLSPIQLVAAGGVSNDDEDDDNSTSAGMATPSHTHTRSASTSSAQQSFIPYSPSSRNPLRLSRTHHQDGIFSERSPLFRLPVEAPPAYTASPTSPTTSSPVFSQTYQTFGSSGMGHIPDESRHLLDRPPQSMADRPYDDEVSIIPVWARFPPRWRPPQGWVSRKTIKTLLGVALLCSVVAAFLVTIMNVVAEVHKARGNLGHPEPGDQPTTTPMPDLDKPIVWNPPATCKSSEHRVPAETFSVQFASSRALEVLEADDHENHRDGRQPHVFGDIVVRRQRDTGPDSSISLEIVTNDASLAPSVSWDNEQQKLKIMTPSRVDWTDNLRPCIEIRATLWVPEHAVLDCMSLGAVHLNVKILDDLSLKLERHLTAETVVGDIRGATDVKPANSTTSLSPSGAASNDISTEEAPDSFSLDSREISVTSVTGDITGWWPLYDSLHVTTESGSIRVAVGPKPFLEARPLPALLVVKSVSGNVRVEEPIDEVVSRGKSDDVVPPRDYVSEISTVSGNIDASVAFTTKADLETISGDISAVLLPVLDVSLIQSLSTPELATETRSGDSKITVLEPIWVSIAKSDIEAIPPSYGRRQRGSIPFTPIGEHDAYDLLPPPDLNHRPTPAHPDLGVRGGNKPPLRVLAAGHKTVSGDINLKYPSSWEGIATATSISGTIAMKGHGLVVTRSRTGFPRYMEAKKGKGSSMIAIETATGDTKLLVG